MWDFLKSQWKKVPAWLAAPTIIIVTLVAFGAGFTINTPKGAFSCALTHDLPGVDDTGDTAEKAVKELLKADAVNTGGKVPMTTVEEPVKVESHRRTYMAAPAAPEEFGFIINPDPDPVPPPKVMRKAIDMDRVLGQCR